MENARPEATEFMLRRLSEDCPGWAIGVPVVFAFLVIAIVFLYRQEISVPFKIFVGFIALGGIYTAVSAIPTDSPVMAMVRLAWVLGFPVVLFLLLLITGIVMRSSIADAPFSSVINGFLFLLGFLDLFAMALFGDKTSAPFFIYTLAALMVFSFLWEVRQQPVALVAAAGVFFVSLVYVGLAFFLVNLLRWMVILLPALAVALFYVGMMYIKDMRSVHFIWAIFLGLLRVTVYLILAVVFLLPGCQYSDKQEYESKVIVLFDVSGSMFVVDDLVEPGVDPKTLQSRQEKIVRLMTDKKMVGGEEQSPFLDRVVEKSPLLSARFGPILDDIDMINLHAKKQKSLPTEDWRKWLNPDKKDILRPNVDNLKDDDPKRKELLERFAKRETMVDTLRSGTNIGGACLSMHKLEGSGYVQAIIVVSDGQSNVGSDDARSQFLDRVNSSKRTIPVITIGVGQFRLPVSIRIDDINAPEETRPDDPFRVKVPVVSTGIPGEEFEVILEVQRIENKDGKPVKDQAFTIPTAEDKDNAAKNKDKKNLGKGKFIGAGDQQQGIVEFEVNVQALTTIKSETDTEGLLEGKWQIKARTKRHEKEPFPEEFHESEPIYVQIQKRALRVLLFCGGATREYQFLRTVLFREMTEKRMEFCILNQSTGTDDHVDQDVPPERMLQEFPDRLGPNATGKQFQSLSDYDVIVAFDPDWTKLTLKQRKLLYDWVSIHGGGVIFVAGPVYSHQIARPAGENLDSILSLFPVVLKDARLHGLGLAGQHDPTRPYPLVFNPAIKQFDFIKLDEAGEGPMAGWKAFFWGREGAMPGPDERPKRGFFTYYPVERIKPNSTTIAAFGAKEARIGEKQEAFKDQQPFMVTMPVGPGKSLYLGSGELWRLRAHKDGFHERIWIKMFRHVAAGAKEQKKYGRLVMPRVANIGRIEVDAMLKGKDFQPLDATVVPTVLVRKLEKKNRPDAVDKNKDAKDKDKEKEKKDAKVKKEDAVLKFDLKAKPVADGESWQGNFYGHIILTEDGEYEFRLPIPGVDGEYLTQNLVVRKPNPELDNVRTNFAYLYQLASPSDTLLKKEGISADTKKRIESLLQAPEGALPGAGEKATKRLFFTVANADAIPDCLVQVPPKTDTVKGRFEDLWDRPVTWPTDWPEWVFWAIVLTPVLISFLPVLIFLLLKSWQGALGCFVLGVFIGLIPVAIRFLSGVWVDLLWAVIITPLLVGLVGLVLLLVMRQWISAIAFFVATGVISALAALFAYFPEASVFLACGLVGAAALGYGIYVLVKKDFFVATFMGAMIVVAALTGIILPVMYWEPMGRLAADIRTESLPIGFSMILVTIVALIGMEWLTRKLLRLA
jgi:hypothetical protein